MVCAGISTIRKPMSRPQHRLTSLLSLAILLLAMVGCLPSTHSFEGEVSLAISEQVAGYAVVGGERYGFATDVADTVAHSMGCKLRLAPKLSTQEIHKGLKSGEIDVAVVPRSERLALHDFPAESLYTTDYVLLMPSWRADALGEYHASVLAGKRILSDTHLRTHSTFKEFANYGVLCDTAQMDCVEMARRVISGKAFAMVCERSEAELVRFLYRSLCEVATIEEECEVILVFGNRQKRDTFIPHLDDFFATEAYATLLELYFGETSIAERFAQLKYRPTRVVNGISVWDQQLREIAEKVGVDWRLMSAMAYHESRFRNDQVSHKGAVGLMQVTPIVAEDLGLDEGYDLADPDTNISLAARLLRRSSIALGFGTFPSTDDGLAILVASYNCGITRVLEAQRLVVAQGGSSESWNDISQMLSNMSNPEWIATSDYKMRRFGDAPTTIAYTNGVMELYKTYREAIQ